MSAMLLYLLAGRRFALWDITRKLLFLTDVSEQPIGSIFKGHVVAIPCDASGQTIGHKASVRNYHYALCIIPEKRSSPSRRKPENHVCLQEIKSTALECLPVAKF